MKKKNGYWSKENCVNEAKKYDNITSWKNSSGGSYNSSRKNNWFEDCIRHMEFKGNRYKRLIYVAEFSDNHAYVGLTFNLEKRKQQHLSPHNKSYVYKYMVKSKIKPKFIILTDLIDVELAKKMEEFFLNYYINNNWLLLNKIKTGGLGGNVKKYTKMACQEDALKYTSKSEWKKKSYSVYITAHINKWIDDCCSHMIQLRRKNGYWTLNRCKEDALKYNSRSEWQLKSIGYSIALNNKWLDECCKHMKLLHHPNGYWTLNRCKEDALKYNSRSEWRKKSCSASTIASKNKWLDECCKHMINKKV